MSAFGTVALLGTLVTVATTSTRASAITEYTMSVTQSTKLTDGQTVQVTSTQAWPTSRRVFVVQCAEISVSGCDNDFTEASTDDNGSLAVSFTVTRYVYARLGYESAASDKDCFQMLCYVVVAERDSYPTINFYGYSPIYFGGQSPGNSCAGPEYCDVDTGATPPMEITPDFAEPVPSFTAMPVPVAATRMANRSMAYMALGDSFSAGEGLDPGSSCARSENAYPEVLTTMVPSLEELIWRGSSPVREQDTFTACTGAKINDVLDDVRDKDGNIVRRAQIKSVTPDTEAVTFSIGGNDVAEDGFGEVFKACIEEDECRSSHAASVSEQIHTTVAQGVKQIIDEIDSRTDFRADIYVVGYPHLLTKQPPQPSGSNPAAQSCIFGWGGARLLAMFGKEIGLDEAAWLYDAVDDLDDTIKGVVDSYNAYANPVTSPSGERITNQSRGVYFVDTRQAFTGHELCGTDGEYFFTIDLGGAPRSLHPTYQGHTEMAAAVANVMKTSLQASGTIAFAKPADENDDDIWLTDASGTKARPFLTGEADDSMPAISPLGTAIAFQSNRGPGQQCSGHASRTRIWIMNTDGSGSASAITCPVRRHDRNPAWSPDGTRIAFDRSRAGGVSDIWMVNADGTGLQRLTRDGVSREPSWSPDGTWIAFTRGPGFETSIAVMKADGTEAQPVTMDATYGSTKLSVTKRPKWSPDGMSLLFLGLVDSWDVFTVRLDGSDPSRLTDDTKVFAHDEHPSWSPEGTWIVFDSERGGGWSLLAVRADGSDTRAIVDEGRSPAWDGQLQLGRPTPLCAPEVHTVSPGTLEYMPPHKAGDKDFGGGLNRGKADIEVTVSLEVTTKYLRIVINMRAAEPRSDWTLAEGQREYFVYQAPPGKKIVNTYSASDPTLRYTDETWEDDEFGATGGVVGSYSVRGDHKGSDAGTWTRVKATLNPITIQLVERGECT